MNDASRPSPENAWGEPSKEGQSGGGEGALEYAMRIIRRRWLVFVVALVSVPLIAFLVSASKEKLYTAKATLLFVSGDSSEDPTRVAATNEALAGLPVVATDVGGNPELVDHDVTGLLVPPASPSALTAALRRYCSDAGLATLHGKAGRDRVTRELSLDHMVRAYTRLYASLCTVPRAGRRN